MAVVLVVAGSAQAAEKTDVTDADRAVTNYVYDNATVPAGQVRVEIHGTNLNDNSDPRLNFIGQPASSNVVEEKGGRFDVFGSYGLGANSEVGFDVPTFIMKQRKQDPTTGVETTTQNEDIGDVTLHLKFKRTVATNCTAGAGVLLSLPTGIERKAFGTGEFGSNPFLATRYQKGRLGAGLHVGYMIYTGDVANTFNYGAELYVRGSESYLIRGELRGRHFETGGQTYDDVIATPGLDYNLFPNFTIRPTGLVGLSADAIEWGVGVGAALTF
jgi:hypothetical protein